MGAPDAPPGFMPRAHSHRKPFVLRRPRRKFDTHSDYIQYQTLELYDAWLRGASLTVGEHYEDYDEFWHDAFMDQHVCEAARVTALLRIRLRLDFGQPHEDKLRGAGWDVAIDARLPAVVQHETFSLLGWPLAPPSTGQLYQYMISYDKSFAEAELAAEPWRARRTVGDGDDADDVVAPDPDPDFEFAGPDDAEYDLDTLGDEYNLYSGGGEGY